MQLLQTANDSLPRTEKEKQKMIENAAFYYAQFLLALGFDYTKDANSQDTPTRVAKAWVEDLIKGCVNPEPKITSFPNEGHYDGIVFQGDIDVVSLCSHHNLAFTGKACIAYIPGDNVVGLSKLNRVVDYFARRPQIQEGLTMQIHKYLDNVLEGNKGVAVYIEANHTCCSNRGIGHKSTMKTAKLTGYFFENSIGTKDEFYQMVTDLKK